MMYTLFNYELDDDGIATFTVNRPEKLNAMNDDAWRELGAFMDEVEQTPEIRAVILTGAGEKAFIAGADLNSLAKKRPATCLGNIAQTALNKVEHCSKPVIAAVNGFAFGGGCETAIACDFRIVSEKALFALPETGLGILPGAGGTQRLSRLIGMGRALDMILLGRKVGGQEAVEIGLATLCVPNDQLMDAAKKTAKSLLTKGPVAVRIAKQVVRASMSSSQDVGLLLEKLALSALFGTEDKAEGVGAFLEKRDPHYTGN